tara:strand:- start:3984 stop:4964 length:981 start_codon:yes stop_codon:yes gene_type:complete
LEQSIGATAAYAHQQIGSENRFAHLLGATVLPSYFEDLEGLASRKANQNDQNRRSAGLLQGWQFWKDQENEVGNSPESGASWFDSIFGQGKGASQSNLAEGLLLVNSGPQSDEKTSSDQGEETPASSNDTPFSRLIDTDATLGNFFEGFKGEPGWSEIGWTLGLLPVAYLKHVVFNTVKLFGGAILQDYSALDFTWGLPATALGLGLGTLNVLFGADVEIHKSGVLKLDGAPIATPAGFSLGPVLTSGSKGFSKYGHEAGHSMQNRLLGPAYLGVIIWSLLSGVGASVLGQGFGLDWWTWDDHADLKIEKWADDLDGVYNEKHSWL